MPVNELSHLCEFSRCVKLSDHHFCLKPIHIDIHVCMYICLYRYMIYFISVTLPDA